MKNYKILAILPHSIAGRLIVSSARDGFYQNGHKVDFYDELKQDNFKDYLNKDYDFIFGYDFSPVILKIDNSLKVPCIAYFSDDIDLRTSGVGYVEYRKYLLNKDIYTFYWDRQLTKKENNPNVFYMPHFVNLEIYKDFGFEPKYDVLFMGRLDTDLRLNLFIKLAESLNNISLNWYAIEKHYLDALSRTNEKGKEIIKSAYKGFIDNEKDMADVINNHKIVYNVNAQGISSLNYRAIQTLACKRLLISDKREELDLFNNLVPVYNNFDDLVSKIKYYLNNKEEYNKIVEACYKNILKNHNAKAQTNHILENILKNIGEN